MGYMERFQVDGQWMAEDELAPFVSQVKEAAEKVEEKTDLTVTVFEIETAIAFLYFREKQCDYVVLEAGMGGLLDATNVIDTTVLSIFASISMDHIGVLGNTLEEIAENKAGIIKPSCLAVVTSPQQMSVTDILQKNMLVCRMNMLYPFLRRILYKFSRQIEVIHTWLRPSGKIAFQVCYINVHII